MSISATISPIVHFPTDTNASALVDELLVLVEGARPTLGSSRHRISGIKKISIRRDHARRTRRDQDELVLEFPDPFMSSHHALVELVDGIFWLTDNGSKNGTFLDGKRISRQALAGGDIFQCGATFFRIRLSVLRPNDAPSDLDSPALMPIAPNLLSFDDQLMAQILMLPKAAKSDLPILILGESGTGKESIARAAHLLSERGGAFIGINCGALPASLAEAELFGARRGAFTGAVEEREGLVRASSGGTLFLDEVADLPSSIQPVLLRVLQEREVFPIGSTRPIPVNLRIVSATNVKIDAAGERGRFRPDLLGRLMGFTIKLPPLRDRLDDFGIILSRIINRHAVTAGMRPTINADALWILLQYRWPLNIRELEHAIRTALAIDPRCINADHLPVRVRSSVGDTPSRTALSQIGRRQSPHATKQRETLRTTLIDHLRGSKGNIAAVAREMGRDRKQIRDWIDALGIDVNSFRTLS